MRPPCKKLTAVIIRGSMCNQETPNGAVAGDGCRSIDDMLTREVNQ